MVEPQRTKRFIKRPDDKFMKESIDALKAEIKKLDLANAELNAKIEKTVPDPEIAEKRKSLQSKLKTIISKQANLKQERNAIQEQIKNVDTNLKRKVSEIQKLTAKNNYKSVSDIDARVKYLDELIGSGSLILADERRYVKEMTALRKLRKDFSVIEKEQASIDKDKEKIADLKKKLSTIGSKEVQQEFEKTQKELDSIFEANKSVYKNRTDLINQRNANGKLKDAKYDEIKKLRADFDAEFAKFKADMAEEQKKRDEEYKAEREAQKKMKLKEIAAKKLEEASIPAFTKEINEIHTLLAYFDPSYVKPQENTIADATKATLESNNNIRQIEMPTDVVILKKEQQAFFEGSKAKKSKKKSPKNKNFTVDSDIILSLTELSVPLPTKTGDVPNTVNVLKETLTALKEKQDEQTKVNIARAEAEIEKLEVVSDNEVDTAEDKSN